MEVIESRDNSLLKHVRKLKIKKYRQESGEFVIEGLRFVDEAILAGANIKCIMAAETFYKENIEASIKKAFDNYNMCIISDDLFKGVTDTKSPQGIAAIVGLKQSSLDYILENAKTLLVIDRIQDPGNLGTIIRTAHAANIDGLILLEGTTDPLSPKVLRSTMGSIFRVPIAWGVNFSKLLPLLRRKNFKIYTSRLEGGHPYYDEVYGKNEKMVLVIGNEANGVDESIILESDRLIKIPMPGNAESLNAAVACGIMIFEILRQKGEY